MPSLFSHLPNGFNAVVIGASGGIGRALCMQLCALENVGNVYAFSRSDASFDANNIVTGPIDYSDESTIEQAAQHVVGPIHVVLVATGILHDAGGLAPEKALRDLSHSGFEKNFLVNTVGPGLVAKHFLPLIPKEEPSFFAAISARVGSISDNQIGGWYAYRAAKSALNMIIKNTAIEMGRRYKQTTIVGLHPGTVDTNLSKPFQGAVKHDIFSPEQSANYLLEVVSNLTPTQSGKCFAWDGAEIPA